MQLVVHVRPRIIVFDLDWETRRSILAGRSTGDPVLKGFPADRLHGVVQIVVQELTPLHHLTNDNKNLFAKQLLRCRTAVKPHQINNYI
jgi:hypothetical protein